MSSFQKPELPPVKSGFHFYKHLKADTKTSDIPFAFVTAVDEKVISKIVKGADIHIQKPIKSQAFLQKIQDFTDKRLNNEPKAALKKTRRNRKVEKSIIKVLDLNINDMPKPAREKVSYPIMPLPPGHSTKYFSVPMGIFDSKMLKSTTTKVVKLFKSGSYPAKENDMLFPSISETAPPSRLVPVNIPEPRQRTTVSDDEMLVVDFELNDEEVQLLEESSQEASEIEIRDNGLRNAFMQYIRDRAFDFQLATFENMIVIDEADSVL